MGWGDCHSVTSHVIQGKGWCLSAIDRIFGTGISVEKRFYLFSTLDRVFVGYTIMILLYICTTKQYLTLIIYNM